MNATPRTRRRSARRALALAALLATLAPLEAQQVAPVSQSPAVAAVRVSPATAPADADKAGLPDPPHATTRPAIAEPGGLMDRAVDSGAQVYVDDSFAAVEKLRAAIRFDQQGQDELAIRKYQDVIDEFGQKLLYLNDDSYVSITDYVRERLLAMPAVRKGEYDQFYGLQAQRLIDTAIAKRDLTGLVRACDEYFPATSAVAGSAQAAEWYFERGDFAAAARLWTALATHPRATDRRAEFLHHAIVAEKLAGRSEVARKLRDQLAALGDPTGVVLGRTVHLVADADEVLKQSAWEKPIAAVDEWPMFGGSPARNTTLDVNSQAGSWLWSIDLHTAGAPNTAAMNPALRMSGDGNPVAMPSSFPVMSRGQLFIHAHDQVISLSATAGHELWRYPLPGQRLDSPGNQFGPYYSAMTHDSCTVDGDEVFAVLPASARRTSANTSTGYPMLGYLNTRVVCLSRTDGHEIWSRTSSDVAITAKGMLMFVGAPLVERRGVFVMARKVGADALSQQYLVRLDRDTGDVSWVCYLCSTSTGVYYGGGLPLGAIALPSMADDVLYVSTGQGADCAVDASAGRILWLQITDAAKQLHSPYYPYGVGLITPPWKSNAPVVYQDKLATLDPGSNLRIYDRWSGHLLAKVPSADLDKADILAGIVGPNLVTVGSKVHLININNTKDMIDPVAFPTGREGLGKLAGRPFLATKLLYLPFDKGLAVVDLASGKIETTAWPTNDKREPGKPGNLLVTSEQILVASEDEVSGYSRWETARDNRLAEIRKNPQDPRPYVALAEVAFRTAHWDLAQQNMATSVELATGAQTEADADFLLRLYQTNLNFAGQMLDKTDTTLRDRARFYFQECKATARDPQTNAEWRLAMAPLSLQQQRWDEAATLYNEILCDAGMRAAEYHWADGAQLAGVMAETRFKELMESHGRDVYRKFEDQAAAVLAKARAASDLAALHAVVDSYPNSGASLAAAKDLADIYKSRADWTGEKRILLWAYHHQQTPQDKARTAVELAEAWAALKKGTPALDWAERGRRHDPALTWNEAGKTMDFAQFRADLKARLPDAADFRNPALSLPMSDVPAVEIDGQLLTPIEPGAAQRRPDLLLVYHAGAVGDRAVQAYQAPFKGPKWSYSIDEPPVLLGYAGNVAVLATAHGVIGLDASTGEFEWRKDLTMTREEMDRNVQQTERARQAVVEQARMGVINGPGLVVIGGDFQGGVPAEGLQQYAADTDAARIIEFRQAFGQPNFTTLKIIGSHLIALSGNHMTAINIATGKYLWRQPVTLPDGAANVVVGNDDFVVAQVDSADRATPTFVVVDADTGATRATLKLDDERVLWRALGEDGTLYLVSDQAVSAYNLHGSLKGPIWRRDDIRSRFPAASALTLDGLIVLNAVGTGNELVCLPAEGGEPRWRDRSDLPEPQGPIPFMRTIVDGDNITVLSPQGVASYRTTDGTVAWAGEFLAHATPPFVNAQIAEPYLIVCASGPVPPSARTDSLYFLNRVDPKTHELANGRDELDLPIPLQGAPARIGADGPAIRAWQSVDGGVAVDADRLVRIYASTPK